MKIIDKEFNIKEIAESALSAYSNKLFNVVSPNINFPFDEDGNICLTAAKDIKGVNLSGIKDGFQVCTDIIQFSDIEKIENENIETAKKLEAERIATFKGYNFKVYANYPAVKSESFRQLYEIAIEENNKRELIYDDNDQPVKFLSYWNVIKPTFLKIIDDFPSIFKIETR